MGRSSPGVKVSSLEISRRLVNSVPAGQLAFFGPASLKLSSAYMVEEVEELLWGVATARIHEEGAGSLRLVPWDELMNDFESGVW